jgi:hypothetical protein
MTAACRIAIAALAALAGLSAAGASLAAVPATGPAQAREAISGLVSKVQARWVLDCEAPGAREMVASVRFAVGSDGQLVRGPELVRPEQRGLLPAEAARAAVQAGAPYTLAEIPADYRNLDIVMNFSAKEACSRH